MRRFPLVALLLFAASVPLPPPRIEVPMKPKTLSLSPLLVMAMIAAAGAVEDLTPDAFDQSAAGRAVEIVAGGIRKLAKAGDKGSDKGRVVSADEVNDLVVYLLDELEGLLDVVETLADGMDVLGAVDLRIALALDLAGVAVKYVTSHAEDNGIEAVGLAAAEVVGGLGKKVKDGNLTGAELGAILRDAIAPLQAWRGGAR